MKWISGLNQDVSLNTNIIRVFLSFLFFLSGCSALIYQVMWQRMLFTLFGMDLESITIIVSVFMFGLGMGALVGGWIADKMVQRLLIAYMVIEFGIAVFGLLSPAMMIYAGKLTSSSSDLTTALVSYFILALPTLFMGATFPMLVSYVNRMHHNIGRSVGELYFVNTVGAAVGAYFSGFILLYCMDMVGAIDCAAYLNISIGVMALLLFRKVV